MYDEKESNRSRNFSNCLRILYFRMLYGLKKRKDPSLSGSLSQTVLSAEVSETEAQAEKPASDAKFAFEIVSTAMSTDYEGKSVLVVEYNFTNNSDETTSFTFACRDKVFQNGIECDSSVIGCDDVDSQMQLTDIQPGTTYTLKVGYHAEPGTPVDIQITSLFGDETYLEQTVEI